MSEKHLWIIQLDNIFIKGREKHTAACLRQVLRCKCLLVLLDRGLQFYITHSSRMV